MSSSCSPKHLLKSTVTPYKRGKDSVVPDQSYKTTQQRGVSSREKEIPPVAALFCSYCSIVLGVPLPLAGVGSHEPAWTRGLTPPSKLLCSSCLGSQWKEDME